jgi:hypothetical protein
MKITSGGIFFQNYADVEKKTGRSKMRQKYFSMKAKAGSGFYRLFKQTRFTQDLWLTPSQPKVYFFKLSAVSGRLSASHYVLLRKEI